MEEDVEIELLLQSNEEMLIEAAQSGETEIEDELKDMPDHPEENDQTPDETSKCTSERTPLHCDKFNEDETNTVLGNNRRLSAQTVKYTENKGYSSDIIKENNTNVHFNEEVVDLLDDQIVMLMSEIQPDPVNTDEESSSSVDSLDDNWENDRSIDKIIEGDSKKRNKSGKQPRKNFNIRPTQDLYICQRLIYEKQLNLMKFGQKLQAEIQENIEKQRKIKNLIDALLDPDNLKVKEPSYTRCFFKKFGMPYFEDYNGFNPPRNEDHNKKIERGELIVTSIPKVHFWVKSDQEIFMEAVKQTLILEHSERLIKEINKYKKDLDTLHVDNNELCKKIEERQEKLVSLRRRSYLELTSQENPNREYDWMKFSATVFNGNHSPEECKRYWNLYLKPTVNKSAWKGDEDMKLLETAEMMQYQDWDSIANLLGTNRTAYQCLVRYQTRLHPENSYSSGKWTQEEDQKLLTLINHSKMGEFIPWSKISSHMSSRNHHQIYNRWSNCLNPKLVKGKFTKEEDLLIVSGIDVFGSNYKELAFLLKNRSCAQIRDRYERHLAPKTTNVGTWALEEDEKLLRLIEKHGDQNWSTISKEMKTRTRTQVRQRYNFIQYMMSTKTDWSIKQVKRRKVYQANKGLQKTEKYVKKLKEKIELAENDYKLSKLESDTFRFEKLKELRDDLLRKKFDNKRKKQVMIVNSEVNSLLIEYFKNSSQSSISFKNYPLEYCNNIYMDEILLMAKFFEHDIVLPELDDEIQSNPRLSKKLKDFLCQTRHNVQSVDSSITNLVEESLPTSSFEKNIDYVNPTVDNSIYMNEWWHSAPIDITSLNFSEMFKRTVFDYSCGMHADIWKSKINRLSMSSENYVPVEVKISQTGMQQSYATPNALTVLGLRSLYVYRSRLKRKASGKGLLGLLNYETNSMQNDCKVDFKVLDKFQETMFTLFTWPKVLSVTDIRSTSLLQMNQPRPLRYQKSEKLQIKNMTDLTKGIKCATNQLLKNEDPEKCRLTESLLQQSEAHKYKISKVKKRITLKKKIQIEQKPKKTNENGPTFGRSRKSVIPPETDMLKVNTLQTTDFVGNDSCKPISYQQCTCETSKEISNCHVHKKNKSKNMSCVKPNNKCYIDSCNYNSISTTNNEMNDLSESTVTYRRTRQRSKRSSTSNENTNQVAKKTKPNSEKSILEKCLENAKVENNEV